MLQLYSLTFFHWVGQLALTHLPVYFAIPCIVWPLPVMRAISSDRFFGERATSGKQPVAAADG
jgi:hypothetical protein